MKKIKHLMKYLTTKKTIGELREIAYPLEMIFGIITVIAGFIFYCMMLTMPGGAIYITIALLLIVVGIGTYFLLLGCQARSKARNLEMGLEVFGKEQQAKALRPISQAALSITQFEEQLEDIPVEIIKKVLDKKLEKRVEEMFEEIPAEKLKEILEKRLKEIKSSLGKR